MKTKFFDSLFTILLIACLAKVPDAQAQEAQVGKLSGHADQGKRGKKQVGAKSVHTVSSNSLFSQ